MRCENCQTDVAAQVAEDGSIICGNCGCQLDAADHPQLDEQLRQARELLERWSKEPLLEPLEPLPGKQASHLSEVEKFQAQSESEPEPKDASTDPPADAPPEDSSSDQNPLVESPLQEERQSPAVDSQPSIPEVPEDPEDPEPPQRQPENELTKPKFRFDAAHVSKEADADPLERLAELNDLPEPEPDASQPFDFDALDASSAEANDEIADSNIAEPAPAPQEPEPVTQTATAFKPRRIDEAQPVAVHSPPHIDIQQLIDRRLQEEKQGFNWMVFAGQWLSYLGVLGLTAGAALIVYGYFGGSTEMVPKGWMLTTAGQMLLLLGIVTLISGGLDQANSEVNTRIQVLGEQMLRFERETKEQLLRGPKIPASQYAEDARPADTKKTADEKTES